METLIKKYYPGAKEGKALTRECIDRLVREHQFDLDKTILGTSVCSDEIIRSATNFRNYVGVENPFSLGGLGGFPFSGVTGFGAFAAHVPNNGFAILLYGPHIGFSKNDRVGHVHRHGQALESTCCGALEASVQSLVNRTAGSRDPEYDYQQWKLEDELGSDAASIVEHSEPLVGATDVMYRRIDQRIKQLLERTSGQFSHCTVALIGGIIINTDAGLSDWFELREFSVHAM